jgi:hypothetical protein
MFNDSATVAIWIAYLSIEDFRESVRCRKTQGIHKERAMRREIEILTKFLTYS